MGQSVDFDGSNKSLLSPAGAENIPGLRMFTNGICCVSCWQLSPEEIAEVIRTGRVFISVMSGRTQPPVFVGSETTTREVIADYGVWKR